MNETIQQVGERIGKAIARDVIADGMPRDWTGFDAQDVDQVPEGMDLDAVELIARDAFHAAVCES